LILAAAALLLFYRFAFPWTPFWVDVSVVVIGALIAVAQLIKKHKKAGASTLDTPGADGQ